MAVVCNEAFILYPGGYSGNIYGIKIGVAASLLKPY